MLILFSAFNFLYFIHNYFVHYPKEYFCTLFKYSSNEETSEFIKQLQLFNINIGIIKYGQCSKDFEIDYEKNTIKFGLNKIKGIRATDIELITSCKITNKIELLKFIVDKKLNKKTIEVLCRLDYFSDIIDKNLYKPSISSDYN